MRNTIIALASALTFVSPAVLAQASSGNAEARAGAAAAQKETPDSARVSTVLSHDVQTRSGEGIGRVEELIVDRQSGQVQQVIVGVGGFLGIGEKSVALPWNQIRIEYDMKRGDGSQPPALGGDQAASPSGTTGAAGSTTRAGEVLVGEGAKASSSAGSAPMGAELPARTTPARRAGVSTADFRIVVDMTKEQLQAAPEYRHEDDSWRPGTRKTQADAARGSSGGATTR